MSPLSDIGDVALDATCWLLVFIQSIVRGVLMVIIGNAKCVCGCMRSLVCGAKQKSNGVKRSVESVSYDEEAALLETNDEDVKEEGFFVFI